MSQTHDLIFNLEHRTIKGKKEIGKCLITPIAGRNPSASGDSDYEPEDFDDEEISGLTADEVKQVLREVIQYGKKGKSV